jgi:hypothetical protein
MMTGKVVSGEGSSLPKSPLNQSESLNAAPEGNCTRVADDAVANDSHGPPSNSDFGDCDTSDSLSPLAMAQIRLDVEAAFFQAGRKTSVPVDIDFFDPFELGEDELQAEMSSLGRVNDFDEMRARAENRFPLEQEREDEKVQRLVAQHKAYNWLGMKGVIAFAALWLEAERKLNCTQLEEYANAVGLPANSSARTMIQVLAERYALLESRGLSDSHYWCLFAVISLMDKERFEQLISVSVDMGAMFADDLVKFFHEGPLDARMERKAERGLDDPTVVYRFQNKPQATE